jgi:hypothetical protein
MNQNLFILFHGLGFLQVLNSKNMRITILILISVIHSVTVFPQGNLVPNGDFEIKNDCPTKYNENGGCPTGICTGPLNIPGLAYWLMPGRKNVFCKVGSPDYFHTCGFDIAPLAPKSGEGYTGIIIHEITGNSREYITAKMIEPLQVGKMYYVEFYVTGRVASGKFGHIGAYFSLERPEVCSYFIDGEPSAHIENSQISYANNWVKVSGSFIASEKFEWITIGNFRRDDELLPNDLGYVFIDDVLVSETCTPTLLIQNKIYNNEHRVYEADIIKAGFNVGAPNPTGNVIVKSNSDITYKGVNKVELLPGFSTEPGARFKAHLAPCGKDCFPAKSPSMPVLHSVCNSQCIGIGGASDPFMASYSWSSIPSNATQYISNPNLSNPLFCPPNGVGAIRYFLTTTDECGESVTTEVLVYYDTAPNDNPSFTITDQELGNFPSFTFNLNPHTEIVVIEFINTSTQQTTLYGFPKGIYFSGTTFSWTLSSPLPNCNDYIIRIKSKNICSSNWYTQDIPWLRNRNIIVNTIPNYFSPPYPPFAQFCVDVENAESYEISVRNVSNTVYTASGSMNQSGLTCLWNGRCNTGAFCNPNVFVENTYFFDITFYNCQNSVFVTGFVFLDEDEGPGMVIYENQIIYNNSNLSISPDTILNQTSVESLTSTGLIEKIGEIQIHPNPHSGSFIVTLKNDIQSEIIIYDYLGKIILHQMTNGETQINIDLTGHAPGLYFVQISDGETIKTEKVVYRR